MAHSITTSSTSSTRKWTLARTDHVRTRYALVMPDPDVIGPCILVFPNVPQSEKDLGDWCKEKFGPYTVRNYLSQATRIPTSYLTPPFNEDQSLPVRIHTPYPSNYCNEDRHLTISVVSIHLNETSSIRSQTQLFSLNSPDLRQVLYHRICQSTRLKLLRRDGDTVVDDLPDYFVVGSLGLHHEKLSREVLMLRAEDVPADSPLAFIRLRVHPTHVGSDVGFILDIHAPWRWNAYRQVQKWQQECKEEKGDEGDKMAEQEVVYAHNILSLRSQRGM